MLNTLTLSVAVLWVKQLVSQLEQWAAHEPSVGQLHQQHAPQGHEHGLVPRELLLQFQRVPVELWQQHAPQRREREALLHEPPQLHPNGGVGL